MRRRKNSKANGRMIPMPKLTLHTPSLRFCWYAARTISTTMPAATKPASTAPQVVTADRRPRFPRTDALSLVASVVVVAHVGYSPLEVVSYAVLQMHQKLLQTSSAETSNTPTNYHHPDHAGVGSPVSRSRNYNTEDQERCSKNNPVAASELVDRPTEEEHPEDLSNQEAIGHPGLHAGGVVLWIQLCKHWVHVAHYLRVVAVGEQSQSTDGDHEDR